MADDYLSRVGKAVARGVPQMATGFVDLAALPFTMTGLLEPEQVFGSTAYLTDKGLLPPPQTGLLDETIELGASMLNPSNAVNAGLIGLGGVIKNLGKGQKVFYHVTDPSNVNKISKEGIIPNKSNKGYTKSQAGGILSEKDKVYAFDNYNDALRWQANTSYMESDPTKTAQIVPFVDDASKYVKDIHPEYGDYLGVFKKEGKVNPDQLLGVEFTQPIAKKSAGTNVGEFTTDDLSKFNKSIPYLQEARMLSDFTHFNPYAAKFNTDLNTPTNFWQSKGMTQRPLNEEDYGILLSRSGEGKTGGGLIGSTTNANKSYPLNPDAKVSSDIPSTEWLNEKRQRARAGGGYGDIKAHIGNALTGGFGGNYPVVPTKVLKEIQGLNLEQLNKRPSSLEYLENFMGRNNTLPTHYNGDTNVFGGSRGRYLPLNVEGVREYKPFLQVDQYGQPFVSEGNHRIMTADKLGWENLPIELRYFEGGEIEKGLLSPELIHKYNQTGNASIFDDELAKYIEKVKTNQLLTDYHYEKLMRQNTLNRRLKHTRK